MLKRRNDFLGLDPLFRQNQLVQSVVLRHGKALWQGLERPVVVLGYWDLVVAAFADQDLGFVAVPIERFAEAALNLLDLHHFAVLNRDHSAASDTREVLDRLFQERIDGLAKRAGDVNARNLFGLEHGVDRNKE